MEKHAHIPKERIREALIKQEKALKQRLEVFRNELGLKSGRERKKDNGKDAEGQ